MLLKDKNILVMGVANKWSIAWGIAKQFHENGANLIFSYFGDSSKRNLEKLLESEGINGSLCISCDVTSDDDVERTFKELSTTVDGLDCVVHCIAHAKKEELTGRYVDTSREGYLMAQDISAYSLVIVSKHAEPLLSEGGSIITLSYLGGERVMVNYNVMGVAKAALEASVKYLAHDLGQKGIRVNSISAGPIRTLAAKGVGDFTQIQRLYEEKTPLRRMVTQEEVGKTAVFLASDLSSGVTGENLHVDGGYHIIGY